jgi:hypothetical protein
VGLPSFRAVDRGFACFSQLGGGWGGWEGQKQNKGKALFSYFILVSWAVLRIRDVYPGSRILIFTHPGSRIPDPKTVTNERGEKNCCHTFFCSHKFHKIEYYFIFEMLKKKIRASFQRIIELFSFYPKVCH